MPFTPQDREFMLRALALAACGEGYVEPNPMVGAVLVKGSRIIGQGYHARFGGPHAEPAALAAARDQGNDPRGATLYVTLEPCAHHGKTPPCAPAVIEAGVARVVMATRDPLRATHPQDAAGLEQAAIETALGLCREEAILLNAPFFKRAATGLPFVIAKWAMSADGKIASRSGASQWISSRESRELVHRVRGRVDAIVVGSHTAQMDDPLLTCRDAEVRRVAQRVVLCGASVPSLDSRLVQTAKKAPVLLAYPEGAPPEGMDALTDAGCEALPVPGAEGHVDVQGLLRALGERGASNVLVEGGAEVLGSFLDADAVDKVLVFVAPIVLGGAEAVSAVGGRGAQSVQAATRMAGETRLADEREMIAARPETLLRMIGGDVFIEGWCTDPLAQDWSADI